jgi:hypothetical protein
VFSQKYDSKLYVKYDAKYLSKIESENPVEFEYLKIYVNESCSFTEMPNKSIDYVDLQKIDIKTGNIIEGYEFTEKDIQNFNPFEYNIKVSPDKNTYYKAGNTGKLLIVWSDFDMRNEAGNRVRVKNFENNKK